MILFCSTKFVIARQKGFFMSNFRYSLEKYSNSSQKVRCPNCGAKRKFVRYIDSATGEILNEKVGKCERINNCGYHLKPREYFKKYSIKPEFKKIEPRVEKPICFHDFSDVIKSNRYHKKTHLYEFLKQYFSEDIILKTFQKYYVGFSNKFNNSTVFWQIDQRGNVRSGKYMKYNPKTGKRDKSKFYWSKVPKGYQRKQCFYGLHLTRENSMRTPIGLVESEKTALICDMFFDDKIIWLASGGMRNLNIEKFKSLENTTVILFPDLSNREAEVSTFDYWEDFARQVKKHLNIDFKINNYLERVSSEFEKELQLDLADFIIKELRVASMPQNG